MSRHPGGVRSMPWANSPGTFCVPTAAHQIRRARVAPASAPHHAWDAAPLRAAPRPGDVADLALARLSRLPGPISPGARQQPTPGRPVPRRTRQSWGSGGIAPSRRADNESLHRTASPASVQLKSRPRPGTGDRPRPRRRRPRRADRRGGDIRCGAAQNGTAAGGRGTAAVRHPPKHPSVSDRPAIAPRGRANGSWTGPTRCRCRTGQGTVLARRAFRWGGKRKRAGASSRRAGPDLSASLANRVPCLAASAGRGDTCPVSKRPGRMGQDIGDDRGIADPFHRGIANPFHRGIAAMRTRTFCRGLRRTGVEPAAARSALSGRPVEPYQPPEITSQGV